MYTREKGIPVIYGEFDGLQNLERTLEDELNASHGPEPWTPREYSSNPDYSEVDDSVFDYLEADQ